MIMIMWQLSRYISILIDQRGCDDIDFWNESNLNYVHADKIYYK